ncbi:MAG: hypothetical protein QOF17_553 [Solirubrobacteraceae bacterium]|nr:hypothetical protein [Solirubrobacteraceae bacterium]
MKILFFMRHPGYVRNFDSVLCELARRGHDVHIAFDSMNTKWMAGADPLGNLSGNERITFGRSPRVRTGWTRMATGLRACGDYLRYQQPEYANAPKLRSRAEQRVPARLHGPLNRAARFAPALQSGLRAFDRAIGVDPRLEEYLQEIAPDIVLVTPLVGLGSTQSDYLKAARLAGCSSGLCVASWDNLTNKGLIREEPDLVAVWNEAQRDEAIELHATPADRVAVTGAHSYDHWFSWTPSSERAEFCERVGLDPSRPYILYLGSSPFIAPREHRHVTQWLRALRARPERELQEVGVLIRPHPQNGDQWRSADLSGIGNVTVYPPAGADPVDRGRRDEYFDSIHHAAFVVGVNTSAQIESAIVGRSVYSLLSPEFDDTQRGTLHFEHLAADDGGLLHLAESFDEHARQLVRALRDPDADDARRQEFLECFVRPFGVDEPGAPRLASAIENAAALGPRPAPARRRVLTVLMWPIAMGLGMSGARGSMRPDVVAGRLWRRRGKLVHRGLRSAVSTMDRSQLSVGDIPARLGVLGRVILPPPVTRHKTRRRILFFLNYPGYLRYFDGVIRELADRGYTVLLVFDRPEKQAEGLRALDDMPDSVQVVGRTPRRDDLMGPIARGLRGTADYARYLHPRFVGADYLRDRRRKALDLAPRMALLGRVSKTPAWAADLLGAVLRTAERSIPSDVETGTFIASHSPDLVIVSPLVSEASPQTDVVKSAQALGIPTALCVASWDHLTTKGMIRVLPDRVIVWNDIQAGEAAELHDVPADRVVVTGAQPFDRWFDRRPHSTRDAFCARVGLPADRPYILFVGSTAGISRPDDEETFVRSWIAALRLSDDPALRDAGVLIRPHPYNPGSWSQADLSDLGHVAVWPRGSANPVDEDDRHDYFDSMYHSTAVVGINTSAMIESAIIGRPVHTIRTEDFSRTQGGTLHFHYMLPENGGFLRVATTLEAHVAQLAGTIAHSEAAGAELEDFVSTFLRPHGVERSCTPILADALESLIASEAVRPWRVPRVLLPLTGLLYAGAVRRRYSNDGMVAKETMLTARRAHQLVRRAERALRGSTPSRRAVLRALAGARVLTSAVERRASRRYRIIVPKVETHAKSGRAETAAPPQPIEAAPDRIETTP